MKSRLAGRFRLSPALFKADLLLILVPAAAWLAAVYARPEVITPRCAHNPLSCSAAGVFALDQLSLGMQSPEADRLSFTTQNLAGYLAAALPLAWVGYRWLRRRLALRPAALAAGSDLVLFLETVLWNGIVTELLRITVQRPRPFVYVDPARFGDAPAHYTSFVSGHTSFAASAGLAMVLSLAGRQAPARLLLLAGAAASALTVLTGAFRVLAGRHFITDTIGGAVAGALVALAVAWVHRRPSADNADRTLPGATLA